MTKEEAIKNINVVREAFLNIIFWESTKMHINEAFDMAIKALEQTEENNDSK